MSYIFGIIDFKGNDRKQEFELLNQAILSDKEKLVTISNTNGIHIGVIISSINETVVLNNNYFENENFIVVFDGRIFNHNYLSKNIQYRTNAECFLQAFLRWGSNTGNHINGEFSVIIVNKVNKKTEFFRDHIGARSLTFSMLESKIIITSHQYEIAKSNIIKLSYNEKYLLNRRLRLKPNYSFTYFNEISRVIPGYHYTVENQKLKKEKYWLPEKIERKHISKTQAISTLRDLLLKSVKNRMIKDKLGTHVSGGLDCTGVASMVSDLNEGKEKVFGYSWSPKYLDETENNLGIEGKNEKELIYQFSKIKNVPIHFTNESIEDFQKRQLIPEFEEMNIEYPTMVQANKDGVKMMFSGWGGDEFLSLSNRGMYAHLFFTFKWHKLIKLITETSLLQVIVKMNNEVFPQLDPFQKIKKIRKIRKETKYIHPELIAKHKKYILNNIKPVIYGRKNRSQFILNLLYNYHLPNRMDSWSYFGRKFEFNYTYPLLDKEVLDYWFSLPVEYTYDQNFSRNLYREIMKDILPDTIRLRKDKTENLRTQHSYNQLNNSLKVYLNELKNIDPEINSYEIKDKIIEDLNINLNEKFLHNFFKILRSTHYIKETKILKKYFS
jgi:asparagine synthase (glutamine-hydrolysing)